MYNPNLNKLVLNIDSSQRINGTSTNFTVNPNLSNFGAAKSVMIQSVEVVNNFYNVDTDSTNFKIKLQKIRHQSYDANFPSAPPSFMINVNIQSKNYNATTLTNAIQTAVNNWCSANGVLALTTVQPFSFFVDVDNYKFTISLDASLTDWGFLLPQSSLATNVLGFSNLLPEVSLNNINATNNYFSGVRISNYIDNSVSPPEAGQGRIWGTVNVTSSNNRFRATINRKSDQKQFELDTTLTPNVYNLSNLVIEVNSKLSAFDTANGLGSSFRLFRVGNRLVFRNTDTVNKPFEMLFWQDETPFLKFFELWDNFTIFERNFYIISFADQHYSNVLVDLVNTPVVITMPDGSYTNTSMFDTFQKNLDRMFGAGNVIYNLNSGTLTSGSSLPILFTGTLQPLFGLPNIPDASQIKIGSGGTLPSGVAVQFSNVVINLPYIPIWNALVGDSVLDLRGNDVVFIHSNIQSSLTADGYGSNSRCIMKLPMSAPLGYSVLWNNYDNQLYRFPASNTDMLTFQIKDKKGKILENQNLDWSITLVYYFDA